MMPCSLISSNENIGFIYLQGCVLVSYSLFIGSQQGTIYSLRTFGNVWRHFLLTWVRGRILLASNEYLAARDAAKIPTMYRTPPPKIIIWPKTSILPLLTNCPPTPLFSYQVTISLVSLIVNANKHFLKQSTKTQNLRQRDFQPRWRCRQIYLGSSHNQKKDNNKFKNRK